ncbi:cytochrome P450 monooxygenase [Laetiporus sulphureus 93-53]|uniref:Cytochrome P450 monooxygenase n=1 Tax=Laetiporus sulphureus 93-53 TaxID=1314785 RepID=A0A165GXP4_9APHY|nr:cytochrome P450 monooxygenase [Laetiporus sulphureus 93-53]KZT10970.1 cytochrome P450 monooxygenase [Laetiporus sulphureus 93-53]
MHASIAVALVLILLGVYVAWCRPFYETDRKPLFSGPRPLPLLGNVHQIPADYQHITFAQWSNKYGDVIFARLFLKPILVVNSVEAACDLMEKRGVKYSDRPRFVFLRELVRLNTNTALLPYGELWRRHRRWLQAAVLDKNMLDSYRPLERREIIRLLNGLIQTPDDFSSHLKGFVGALVMEIGYGHTVKSPDNDEFIRLADRAVTDALEAGSLEATLIDFFPILKNMPSWIPGADFKRKALLLRESMRETIEVPYRWVKEAMASGTAKPSFVSSILEEESRKGRLSQDDEDSIMGVGGILYSAGTDTTYTVLMTFILAMVLYPDVCKKAQAEIDKVVGMERLPDVDDRGSMPYLEHVLLEVYRWNPPVPLCVPHQVIGDDEYRGRNIPSGTMVIANIWHMAHDPALYPNPEDFCPERYSEMDVSSAESRDPRKFVFGFGRRLCPGRQFADVTIWLAIASMLAVLDISKARDTEGSVITPVPTFASGAVSHPKPFRCEIRPRSMHIMESVSQLAASIQTQA